jgi:cytidylate kinase
MADSSRILKKLVIAIDGPAGSGKSTTARLVAEKLGYVYLDTGAMYRAVALKTLKMGINPADTPSVEALIDSTEVTLRMDDGKLATILDGQDVTEEIRSPEVTRASSLVSSIRKVREAMVKQQRKIGAEGGVVVEGRDIGSVVFPNADLKIFLTASLAERALRRQRELRAQGTNLDFHVVQKEISQRDEKDSTRDASPLLKAKDAIEIDTSSLTIEEQVDLVVQRAKAIIRERSTIE